jgi:hypothetical protein
MSGCSMVRLRLTLSAAIVFGCSVSAARATTFNVSTSAGRPVKVSNEAAWDDKCNQLSGPFYTFTTKPAHGEISTRSEDKVIATCNAGACGCLGRHVTGTAIYYTPEKTFHGVDQFSFSSRFPNGAVLSHQGIIDVK